MHRRLGYGLALTVLLLDQLTKLWIVEGLLLRARGSVEVIPGFFNLTWVENRGVSMGLLDMGDGGRWPLVILTAAIAVGVAYWLTREKNRADSIALGLILGGAIGNIIDRARLGFVIDFVHLYWQDLHFYVFNVADAAITIGVALLLVRSLFSPRPASSVRSPTA